MLYGKSRKVLNAIRFLCQEESETNIFNIGVYLHNRIQTEDLMGCLDLLSSKDEGYIRITRTEPTVYVTLEHKGRHLYEYEMMKLKQFLRNSIITPIIVSVLTTLITLWITSLIP